MPFQARVPTVLLISGMDLISIKGGLYSGGVGGGDLDVIFLIDCVEMINSCSFSSKQTRPLRKPFCRMDKEMEQVREFPFFLSRLFP